MGTRNIVEKYNELFKDHPHAYGDKGIPYSFDINEVGSSPRVWGQVTRNGSCNSHAWDHPHAYGDKKCKCLPKL